MQKINDFTMGNISFEITAEKHNCIVVKLLNNGKRIHTTLFGSRYISISQGVLQIDRITPSDLEYESLGQDIPEGSFLNIEMFFEFKNIQDGDRIELKLQNIGEVTIIRNCNEWYIYDYCEKSQLEDKINSVIEHFEAIEEKFGITLQNFSVVIKGEKEIDLFCEVLSLSEKAPYYSFAIEVGIYDKMNKIICSGSIRKEKSDFMGFEVFSYAPIYLPKPITEIGRIVFYPTKI